MTTVVGRPRFEVWKHFDGKKDVQCKRCKETIVNAKVEKLERHIMKKCSEWSVHEKKEFAEAIAHERQRRSHHVSLDSMRFSTSAADTNDSVNHLSQDKFNRLIANYIYDTASSFDTVDEPSFIELALKNRPWLRLPSRSLVSGDLLTEAFEGEMRLLVDELKELPFVAVAVDVCAFVHYQKIMNFVLVAPNMQPKVWKSVGVGEESQDEEFIADLVMDVVDEIDGAVGKMGFVAGVVTDDTKAMQDAWTILENERGLICAGCGAHTVNLVLQDIGKLVPVNDAMMKVTRVATFFLQRPLLLARFERERKTVAQGHQGKPYNRTLTLPAMARWYSAFVSVIKNKDAIAGVFRDSEFMTQFKPKPQDKKQNVRGKRKLDPESTTATDYEPVQQIVQDNDFWVLGEQVMKLLAPIMEIIGLLETDGCSPGMVYWSFVDLLKQSVYRKPQFLIETASRILECIEERWKFLHTDAMGIAFFLDPTKDPGSFVDEDLDKALKHVREVAARLRYSEERQNAAFREAYVFLNRKWDWTQEERLHIHGRMAPFEWWGINRLKYPNLFEIARRVFTMPTSSAASERSLSVHKHIHSKLQNLLLSENVFKLVFVYSNRQARGIIPNEVYYQQDLREDEENHDEIDQFIGCDAERWAR